MALSYLRLGETVNPEKNIICTFYVESKLDLLEAAESIAGESSIGTWTHVNAMTSDIFKRLAPSIFYVDKYTGIVKIAYPTALFEKDSIPQLMSSIAGNIFGVKMIDNLRLIDITFPKSYVQSFPGPAFGIQGVRDLVDIHNRPLLGTIIKPKVGLDPKQHAEVAYQAWMGGVDLVKDDENLTNQEFNPFEERVIETLKRKKEAEAKTGKRKVYAANITAEADVMLERAKFVKAHGGNFIMIDVLTAGWSGVQYIRKQNLGLAIHGHRAMHAAFTKNPKHGISMLVIAKASRLVGVDQLHTGTVIGKMEGKKDAVIGIDKSMRSEWFGIKPTFPIASGGLYPGLVPELIRLLGKDLIINLGGGIHGHPDGTYAGAKAAFDALMIGTEGKRIMDVLAKEKDKYPELAKAVEKWGVYKSGQNTSVYTYGMDLINAR